MKGRHFYKEALVFSTLAHIAGFLLIIFLGLVWPSPTDEIIEVTLAVGDVSPGVEEHIEVQEQEKPEEQQEEKTQDEKTQDEDKIIDPVLPPEVKPEQKKQVTKKSAVHVSARQGDGGQDDVTSMPKILKQVKPDYPPAARNMDKQGRVLVELLISSRGVVERADIVQSGGFAALDEAVLKAVYKWRFAAAKNRYGRPCACKVVIPIKFELQ